MSVPKPTAEGPDLDARSAGAEEAVALPTAQAVFPTSTSGTNR